MSRSKYTFLSIYCSFNRRSKRDIVSNFLLPQKEQRSFTKPIHAAVNTNQNVENTSQHAFNNSIASFYFSNRSLTDKERAIKNIFHHIECRITREGFRKWFIFVLIGHGSDISEVVKAQFCRFVNKLLLRLRAIYNDNYRLIEREEVSNYNPLLPWSLYIIPLIIGDARCVPLQNPIKNIICSPE